MSPSGQRRSEHRWSCAQSSTVAAMDLIRCGGGWNSEMKTTSWSDLSSFFGPP
jgi:hypothetical protein